MYEPYNQVWRCTRASVIGVQWVQLHPSIFEKVNIAPIDFSISGSISSQYFGLMKICTHRFDIIKEALHMDKWYLFGSLQSHTVWSQVVMGLEGLLELDLS